MLSAVIFGLNPLLVLCIQGEGINSISLVLLRNMLSIPVLAALAYPLYNRVLKTQRAKIAPNILRISDELLQG